MTIKKHLLLPAILLLFLPFCACLVFHCVAKTYAISQAERDLESLQRNILPKMEETFLENAASNQPDAVRQFLSQTTREVQKTGTDARVFIFSDDFRLVYPKETDASTAAIAQTCIEYLNAQTPTVNRFHAQLKTAQGETVLANFCLVPTPSRRISWMITYCLADQAIFWVNSASRLVLLISLFLLLPAVFALNVAAKRVSRPLKHLSREAARIGEGDFSAIASPFSLKEAEDLRLAMNRMSEQLARSEEAQRTFFQNISHDLRTPLMSISGYAQGIEQGIFDDTADAARTILEESDRLTKLVEEILTLSRLETHDAPPILTSHPLKPLLEEEIRHVQGLAARNDLSLVLFCTDENICAPIDPKQFDQILLNLLSNALRYAKETVTIKVTASQSQVQILVMDDGEGIPPDDLPHLFERSWRGKDGHLGLGLAIAKRAAQNMNASLTGSNREEGGAIFALTFTSPRPPA